MTGIRKLAHTAAMSAAPEQVRVSVFGGHTQVDVALPLDVPVASLVPELVRLVRSRDPEHPVDASFTEARHTFWVLSRLDPLAPLQPNDTLRAAGVVSGELLRVTAERALPAPMLYDDVVDAAARLNKAAYASWNAAAARWMSFGGLYVASSVWVYFLVNAMFAAHRAIIVALAGVVVAAMVGVAALARRWYGQADVGTAVGWATVPISAAMMWALLQGFGDYGVAFGCVLLLVVNVVCYWVIGSGQWGYTASGVFFGASGLAMVSHALGMRALTVGVVLAVAAALACLTVSRLTGGLARFEPPTVEAGADRDAVMFENPFAPKATSTESAAKDLSAAAMPTAEAVWAKVHSATLTRSALFAGLAVSVLCGVATMQHAEPHMQWAALAFAAVCAAALGLYARIPGSAMERVSLAVPAVALAVVGAVSAQHGAAQVSGAGFVALLAIAVVAAVTGLKVPSGNLSQRLASALTYLEYTVFAALIPVALWVDGVYARLEMW